MARWGSAIQSRDEQYDLKREALIREAGRAFGRNGFHSTSLEDVARTLNVTKPALYYYVKNKHELLFECHMAALDLGEQAIKEAREGGGTGIEKLNRFLRRYITLLTGELGAAAVLSDQNALLPADRERVQARRAAVDKTLRDMVREGVKDGSIRSCDPKMAVFCFMGAVNGISRWFRADGPSSGEAIADAYTAFIADGLAAGVSPSAAPPAGRETPPRRRSSRQ